jgi:hypothetical protein
MGECGRWQRCFSVASRRDHKSPQAIGHRAPSHPTQAIAARTHPTTAEPSNNAYPRPCRAYEYLLAPLRHAILGLNQRATPGPASTLEYRALASYRTVVADTVQRGWPYRASNRSPNTLTVDLSTSRTKKGPRTPRVCPSSGQGEGHQNERVAVQHRLGSYKGMGARLGYMEGLHKIHFLRLLCHQRLVHDRLNLNATLHVPEIYRLSGAHGSFYPLNQPVVMSLGVSQSQRKHVPFAQRRLVTCLLRDGARPVV